MNSIFDVNNPLIQDMLNCKKKNETEAGNETESGNETENEKQYDIVYSSRTKQLKDVQTEAFELFEKKNADYGDAFATYGSVGVIVRLGDKINRLSSITKNSVHLVEDEKIRDTLIDLHNYAAMAVMLLDENKTLIKKKE